MGQKAQGWCCAWCPPGTGLVQLQSGTAPLPLCPTLTVIKGAKINMDGFIPAGLIPPPGVARACRAAPEVGDEADKAAGNGNFPRRKEITSLWGVTSHHPPITLFAAVVSLNNSWKQLLGVCVSYTSAPLLTLRNGLMQSQFPKSFTPSRGKNIWTCSTTTWPCTTLQPRTRLWQVQNLGKTGSVRLGRETMSLWWVWSQGCTWGPLGEGMMLSLK